MRIRIPSNGPARWPAFPDWGGNAEHDTHAFGVWQDEPETYAEIVALTGDPSVAPQSQITNNWVLAVRDYKTRSGGDLLATLQAGQLDAVSPALIATWPGGADAGFPARYAQALAMFPIDAPAPPSPTPAPQGQRLEIPLGEQCTVAILSATDRNGAAVSAIPADLLKPDNPTICSAAIAGVSLTCRSVALGSTVLRGADQALPVTIVAPQVAHLVLDLAHPVFAPLAAVVQAMMARLPVLAMAGALLMLGALPAGPPEAIIRVPVPASTAAPSTPEFGSVAFCYDANAIAFERCLQWTAALSRR